MEFTSVPIFKIFKKVLNRCFVKGIGNRELDTAAAAALVEFERSKIRARHLSPRKGPCGSVCMTKALEKLTRSVIRQFTAIFTYFLVQLHKRGVFDHELAVLELVAAEISARGEAEDKVVQPLLTELNNIKNGKFNL